MIGAADLLAELECQAQSRTSVWSAEKHLKMPAAFIEQVSRIRCLGVFQDSANSGATNFKRWNLIYGFNGTGKTTLSRVFASIGDGKLHNALPQTGSFLLKLSDGSQIDSGDLEGNPLSRKLFVFNTDFVEANLRWETGTPTPIFYIGQHQAEAASQLAQKRAALQRLGDIEAQWTQTRIVADRELATLKRTAARTISEVLGLGRRYEAPELTADFENEQFRTGGVLSADDLANARRIATTEEHLPRLPLLALDHSSLTATLDEVGEVAARTVGSTLLADLRSHQEMLGWVKAGLDYHRAHSPHSCVFCGSELGEQRLSSLAEAVDQRFEELVEDIKRVTERVKMVQREYIQLREQVASPSDVAFDARPLYERDLNKYRSHYATAIRSLGEALAVLTEKAATPNRRLGEKRLLGHDAALEWELESKTLTESVNLALVQHNTGYDNFDVLRQSAAKKIKAHYLAMDRSLYDEQLSKVDQAKAAVEKFAKEKGALEREIDDLGRKVREHGPAAVAINRLLHRYLSRTDIELVATEESFSIHRNGKLLSGPLSEGEKTAIALCYFLIGLEAEGRKTKDLIVVVDDPISSLDSRALNYAFSMIKRALSEAGQLIVLTHNLQFMNEVKKWLKRRTRNDAEKPATAALLFIEATQNADGSRSSKLRTLPTFLRDYESEYHYFFNLLWQYSKDAAANEGHSYLLPNAIRKVMEIFFAFHLPGPEGVGDKMQQIARSAVTLGTSEVDALDRLAQVESHSDSLDDFIMMSPMTVEETDRAVGALIKLMAEIAPEHVKRMEKLCS